MYDKRGRWITSHQRLLEIHEKVKERFVNNNASIMYLATVYKESKNTIRKILYGKYPNLPTTLYDTRVKTKLKHGDRVNKRLKSSVVSNIKYQFGVLEMEINDIAKKNKVKRLVVYNIVHGNTYKNVKTSYDNKCVIRLGISKKDTEKFDDDNNDY